MMFSTYVDMIIDQFYEAGGYSEIKNDRLRQVLEKYLEEAYEQEMVDLRFKIKLKRSMGLEMDKAELHIEKEMINRRISNLVEELSSVDKDDI